jgi:hypothetical protein
MQYLKTLTILFLAIFIFASLKLVKAEKGSKAPAMLTKRCMNCHQNYKEMKDILTGTFKSRSKKAKSLQVKIDKRMELVKYTPETKIKNVPDIKSLKEPMPLRIHFKRKGNDLVATEIVVKPKMKVPEKQLMSTKELEKLVALGPEKGGYTLVDSRPPIKYAEGHIPTALSIPFPKMKKLKDKLPKDKNRLLIFYCEGMR